MESNWLSIIFRVETTTPGIWDTPIFVSWWYDTSPWSLMTPIIFCWLNNTFSWLFKCLFCWWDPNFCWPTPKSDVAEIQKILTVKSDVLFVKSAFFFVFVHIQGFLWVTSSIFHHFPWQSSNFSSWIPIFWWNPPFFLGGFGWSTLPSPPSSPPRPARCHPGQRAPGGGSGTPTSAVGAEMAPGIQG